MNFNTAALAQAIHPRVKEMKKGMSKLGLCISMSKVLVLVLLYTAFTMNRISELITGKNILKAIERRHPLANIIKLSFSLLFH